MKIFLCLIVIVLSTIGILFYFSDVQNMLEKNSVIEHDFVQTPMIELDRHNPIKIGIVHSLTGTMANSEMPLIDVYLATLDLINKQGGILGREVIPIIADGASDWNTFALESERLIVEEEVDVVFGGWTSASRKMMKPIFEKYDHLLVYPIQYEGLEYSKNILYTGAVPNQQITPSINWAKQNIGDKIFLVGSDYIFPRSVNEIIKDEIKLHGGQIVGELYRPLGDDDFLEIVKEIKLTDPDIIFNTINGDSNIAFFHELDVQIIDQDIPVISFSITENDLPHIGNGLEGTFLAWNYFSTIDSKDNKKFVTFLESNIPEDSYITDPMEAVYLGLVLYANAVENAKSTELNLVRQALKGMTISAPEGIIGVDPETNHLVKSFRIAQIMNNHDIEIIFSSDQYILPISYPDSRSIEKWNEFLDELYENWNQNWAVPTNILEYSY